MRYYPSLCARRKHLVGQLRYASKIFAVICMWINVPCYHSPTKNILDIHGNSSTMVSCLVVNDAVKIEMIR